MTEEKRESRKAKKKPLHRKGAVINGLLSLLGMVLAAALMIIFGSNQVPATSVSSNEVTNESKNISMPPGVSVNQSVNQNVSVQQNGPTAQSNTNLPSDTRLSKQNGDQLSSKNGNVSPPSPTQVKPGRPAVPYVPTIKCADTISTENQVNGQAGCNYSFN